MFIMQYFFGHCLTLSVSQNLTQFIVFCVFSYFQTSGQVKIVICCSLGMTLFVFCFPAHATPPMDTLRHLQRELAPCHVPRRLHTVLGTDTHTHACMSSMAIHGPLHGNLDIMSLRVTWSMHLVFQTWM